MASLPGKIPVAVLAALAPVLWGTTYVVTTELLPPDRPLLAATLRALPAGLVLALVLRERPVGVWWWRAAVLGVLNIGAFFAFLFIAAYALPGGIAATVGAIQPLVVIGLAAVLLGQPATGRRLLIAGVGLAGVALLVLRAGAGLSASGLAAALAGTLCMALATTLTQRWRPEARPVVLCSWMLVAGGLLLLPVALAVEGPPPALGAQNLLGYLWLGGLGTALAYTLWLTGVTRLPASQVTLLSLLSPVVATLLGWVLLGEALTPLQLLGAATVLGAVVAGQRAAGRRSPPARRPTQRDGGSETPAPASALSAPPGGAIAPRASRRGSLSARGSSQ